MKHRATAGSQLLATGVLGVIAASLFAVHHLAAAETSTPDITTTESSTTATTTVTTPITTTDGTTTGLETTQLTTQETATFSTTTNVPSTVTTTTVATTTYQSPTTVTTVTPTTDTTFTMTSSLSTTTARQCVVNPCWNGATCVWNSAINNATCVCPAGFTDYDCSVDIDECASYPCDPFAECIDGIRGYTCGDCKAGFLPTNTSDRCSDIDECSQSPCRNNATCLNEQGRFRCVCPTSADPNIAIVGLLCEATTTSSRQPAIRGIHPSRGIIAGGTSITITGIDMNLYPPHGANFTNPALPTLYGHVLINSSSSDAIVVTSPRANSSYIGKELRVTVEFSGPVERTVELIYTYTDNPKITDIQPRVQLSTGGILLTVYGSSLDVVGEPKMVVTLRTSSTSGMEETVLCQHNTSDNMLCRMPVLPAEFQGSNNTERDGTAVATIRSANGIANLYVGFELDNLPTYRNISKSNPRITFTLVSYPDVFDHTDASFDPDVDSILTVRGKQFSFGCSRSDYVIRLGSGNCSLVDFTDNLITCSPAKEKPPADKSSFCNRSTADVYALMAQIGSDVKNTFFVYCVTWSSQRALPVALIVGLVVGLGGGLIIIAIVVVVFLVYRRRQRDRRHGPPLPDPYDLRRDASKTSRLSAIRRSIASMLPGNHYETRIPRTDTDTIDISNISPNADEPQSPGTSFTKPNVLETGSAYDRHADVLTTGENEQGPDSAQYADRGSVYQNFVPQLRTVTEDADSEKSIYANSGEMAVGGHLSVQQRQDIVSFYPPDDS